MFFLMCVDIYLLPIKRLKLLDMHKGPSFGKCCSFGKLPRVYALKAVIFCLIVFVLIGYATDIFLYREPIHKLIAPGLAWISSSMNSKLSFEESKLLPDKLSFVNKKSYVNNSLPESLNNTLMKNNSVSLSNSSASHPKLVELCPLVPPKLVGKLKVLTESPSFEVLEKMFSNLKPGGRYQPQDCISRNKVALIIPYRDRERHLRIFLHNMHPFLQRQQLDYGIYVIEETADAKFNRAMLMNIGYVEALKQYDYDCFIFHDVDLIPEDDRNLYTCPSQPRHMSVAINTMNYRLPYKGIFGGVSALTKMHMTTVNGFSNEFWGWGGEDDDMSNRIRHHGLQISRYSPKIARYTMLDHKKDNPNPDRYKKLYGGKYRYKQDGLSNLKYKNIDYVLKKLYTWVLVEIEPIKK